MLVVSDPYKTAQTTEMPKNQKLKLTNMTELASLYEEKLDLDRALQTPL